MLKISGYQRTPRFSINPDKSDMQKPPTAEGAQTAVEARSKTHKGRIKHRESH